MKAARDELMANCRDLRKASCSKISYVQILWRSFGYTWPVVEPRSTSLLIRTDFHSQSCPTVECHNLYVIAVDDCHQSCPKDEHISEFSIERLSPL